MAQHRDTTPPVDPQLHAPAKAEVVDAQDVAFSWAPVPDAATYRLQVAADRAFERLVFDQETGQATSMTVTDVFAADRNTYFWRVLTKSNGAWSHGQRIESFIAGTEADVEAHLPGADEVRGPAVELVTAIGHEDATAVADSPEIYEDDAEGVGVESESINPWTILRAVMAVLVFVTVAIILLFQLTERQFRATQTAAAEVTGYPQLRETEVNAARLLTQYEVVDDAAGVYRIPIDRAMRLMVNETIQDRGRRYSEELPLLPEAD